MESVSVPIPDEFSEYVVVCNTCDEPVTMFSMNMDQKAVCVPCGHTASVTLVERYLSEPDAAA